MQNLDYLITGFCHFCHRIWEKKCTARQLNRLPPNARKTYRCTSGKTSSNILENLGLFSTSLFFEFSTLTKPLILLVRVRFWRRGSESNRRMQLLQSRALPLGYPAYVSVKINERAARASLYF